MTKPMFSILLDDRAGLASAEATLRQALTYLENDKQFNNQSGTAK